MFFFDESLPILFDCKTIFCHRLDKKELVFIVWVDKLFLHPIYTIFDIMGKQKVLCLIVRLYKSLSFNSIKESYATDHPFTCHLNFFDSSLKDAGTLRIISIWSNYAIQFQASIDQYCL